MLGNHFSTIVNVDEMLLYTKFNDFKVNTIPPSTKLNIHLCFHNFSLGCSQ